MSPEAHGVAVAKLRQGSTLVRRLALLAVGLVTSLLLLVAMPEHTLRSLSVRGYGGSRGHAAIRAAVALSDATAGKATALARQQQQTLATMELAELPTPSPLPSPSPSRTPARRRPAGATCAPHTALHPAVLAARQAQRVGDDAAAGVAGAVTPASSGVRRLHPRDTELMEQWGLQPEHSSPLSAASAADSGPSVPWRGSAVEVTSDITLAPHLPVPRGYGRAQRSEEDVKARARYHAQCITTPGPHGPALSVASGGKVLPSPLPETTVLGVDRWELAGHGFAANGAIKVYLQELGARVGVPASSASSPYVFPTASSTFFPGPWIEDYWLATFGRPVVRPVPWSDFQAHLAGKPGVVAADRDSGDRMPEGMKVWPYTDPASGQEMVDVQLPYDPELFHPWVPLFVPYMNLKSFLQDVQQDSSTEMCKYSGMMKGILRLDVQYVTVNQRPSGPWLADNADEVCAMELMRASQNVLVISAGGVGHVPIPLLGQERPFLQCAADGTSTNSSHSVAFLGSERNGQQRFLALRILIQRWAGSHPTIAMSGLELSGMIRGGGLVRDPVWAGWGLTSQDLDVPQPGEREIGEPRHKHMWLRAMAGAQYQFAPRGSGPTSFRLYEALQMGLVPIYVHDGAPWLPYLKRGQNATWVPGLPASQQSLWARIAFVTPTLGLHNLLATPDSLPPDSQPDWPKERLIDVTPERHAEMRMAAASVRDRYFTYDGVVRRIAEFLEDPTSAELDCQGSSWV